MNPVFLLSLLAGVGVASWLGSLEASTLPLPCLLPVVEVPVRLRAIPTPLVGILTPNTKLRHARRLFDGQIQGSESITLGPNGTIYVLDKFGHAWRSRGPLNVLHPGATALQPAPFAYVGPGRPLGFAVDAQGSIVICSAPQGLLRLPADGGPLETLANAVHLPGSSLPSPIAYANGLALTSGGDVVFTDSSAVAPSLGREGYTDTRRAYVLTQLQGGTTGRLLRWVKATGQTEVLAQGLFYPNGVGLAADDSFAIVTETCSRHLLKHWLQGPKAGTTEVLLARLPGYPDGVSRAADGSFWVTIVAGDVPILHWAVVSRWARWALAWGTELFGIPALKPLGWVLKITAEGEIVDSLVDPDGSVVSSISAAEEHDGRLYLASLGNDYAAVLDLKAAKI